MTQIFLVYEILGPNGFLPLIYTKNTLDEIMLQSLKNENFKTQRFSEIEGVLSRDLLSGNKWNDDNIYLIPIDIELEKERIEDILTPKFFEFIKIRDNCKIIYVNYGITLHSLL